MTNKKLFLLIGISMSLISKNTYAEICTPTPDCKSLGYSQNSCPDNKGVRCPWNTNLWHCDSGKKCSDLGFTKTCKDITNGENGGLGTPCDGKYQVCNCAGSYAWDSLLGSCKIQTGFHNGLYYCNGVVKGVQVANQNLVVALSDLGNMKWSLASTKCSEFIFCNKAKGILPSSSQLTEIYNNKSTVNSRLSSTGGVKMTEDWYWSSTYAGSSSLSHYSVTMVNGPVRLGWGSDELNHYVRCVFAF